MRVLTDIDYFGDGNPFHLLDMYLPDHDGFDLFVYFHGGGLECGNRKEIERFMPLVDRGVGLVSVEYRLLPDAKFPDFIDDCATATAYVRKNMKKWGANGRMFVGGASAGAYITMMLCVDKEYLEKAGVPQTAVNGYISESAQMFAHFNLLKHRGFDPRVERIDETAPINFVKDGMDIRPLRLMYYTDDMLCRPEENRLMYQSMKRFLPENKVPDICEIDGGHCVPENINELIDSIYEFIEKTE